MKVKVCKLLSLLFITIFALSVASEVRAEISSTSVAWRQTYPGFGDLARSVIQTKDGGFLILCADLPSTQAISGVFYLLKVDSSGNQQWNRTYQGIIPDTGQYIVQTADGGYAVAAGYKNSFFLMKIDQSGNQQWNQTYTGEGVCVATGIVQTSDGGYALVGLSNDGTSVWLVKTDSRGGPQWNQPLGPGQAHSLVQTTDGGYAVANDFLLIKLDSKGRLQWNRTYANGDENSAYSVVQTSDGGYALGGSMWLRTNGGGYNVAIVKTDATGKMQWTRYFGAGIAYSMTKTSDGGFAIAGDKLVKVNATGDEQWAIALAGQSQSVIQTREGSYAIAGYAAQPWLVKVEAAPPTSPEPVSPSPTVPEFSAIAVVLVMVVVLFAVAVQSMNRKIKTWK